MIEAYLQRPVEFTIQKHHLGISTLIHSAVTVWAFSDSEYFTSALRPGWQSSPEPTKLVFLTYCYPARFE